jgi:hypothetical protein
MALVLADRVQETTTTTGTGTITLAGAVSGFQTFTAAIGNANTTYYTIVGQTTSEFEIGIGTYTTSGTTLSRDTILTSSNSNLAVNFSAGTKNVFVTYPASRSVYANGTTLTASNSSVLPVGSGGTGLTTTPTNGQLDIGNGTGFTRAALTAGTGVSVTNASGSITLANTGVTALTTSSGLSTNTSATGAVSVTNTGVTSNVAGTGISVSGATGAVTITNSGVTSAVAGTGITVSGATGAVTVSIGQAVATSSNVQFNSLGVGTAGSATAGEIRATNNITAYYSDIRLKTKIGDIEDPLGKVHAIKTMLYHANEIAVALGYDASIQEVGVSAQSVQAVQPEAVAPAPIDERYLTVRYEKLVPLLIEAIKALDHKVDALAKELK